ncbi:MAG: indole-3-glycerol phosphate synthase TrpC [bacterium]
MKTILNEIVGHKAEEIRLRKQKMPVAELLSLCHYVPTPRSFTAGLKDEPTVQVIAEIKKASPSAGLIRTDFVPEALAEAYENNGARAVSIITDEKYFQGSLNHIHSVRQVIELPILRKDFILDSYQVVEARAYGADLVLLILNLLTDSQCTDLVDAVQEFRMEFLVEIHTPAEVERAVKMGFNLIGINNRNLDTFEVDVATTDKLLQDLPREITVVSESGIKNRQHVQRLGELGVDAVLIGETLMRQIDVGAALTHFTGVPKWSR